MLWRFLSWIVAHLSFLPWSPKGRQERIRVLMRTLGEEHDVAVAIVYYRDITRHMWLQGSEVTDFKRVCGRIERGEVILPADRKGVQDG